MSNKNVKLKVRLLVAIEPVSGMSESDSDRRPGKNKGSSRSMVIDVPITQMPYTELLQRLSDAQNVLRYGNVVAEALPPVAITQEAYDILHDEAQLSAAVNAQGVSTQVNFQYGTTESLGNTTNAVGSPIATSELTTLEANIDDLTPETKYYYRVQCISATKTTYGLIRSFTTGSAPV